MLKKSSLFAMTLVAALGGVASAAAIDAALIPDGTYNLKAEKVVDATHLQVTMDNGSETTLAAGRSTVDFSKVKANDQLKASIIKGQVVVYLDLTQH